VTYTGNSPDIKLSGLIYAPHMDLTVKGAIDHHTNGYACLGVIANTMLVSGTGSFFANTTSQCFQQGLTLPQIPGAGGRPWLVR
jgi:hypothetical protein